jgi:hypothetical protein
LFPEFLEHGLDDVSAVVAAFAGEEVGIGEQEPFGGFGRDIVFLEEFGIAGGAQEGGGRAQAGVFGQLGDLAHGQAFGGGELVLHAFGRGQVVEEFLRRPAGGDFEFAGFDAAALVYDLGQQLEAFGVAQHAFGHEHGGHGVEVLAGLDEHDLGLAGRLGRHGQEFVGLVADGSAKDDKDNQEPKEDGSKHSSPPRR